MASHVNTTPFFLRLCTTPHASRVLTKAWRHSAEVETPFDYFCKQKRLSPFAIVPHLHVAFDGRNVRSVVGSPCPQNFSHAGSFPPTGRRALAAGPIGHSYVGQGAMGSASILRVYECTPYHSRRAFSARPTRLFYYCRFHVYFDVYAAQRGLRKNGRTCRGRGRPGV